MSKKPARKFVTREMVRVIATGKLGGVGEVDYSPQYGYTYFVDHNDKCDWYRESELMTARLGEPGVDKFLAANRKAAKERRSA